MQLRLPEPFVKLTGRGLIFEGPSSRKLMWVLISPAAEVTWSPSPSVSVTVTPTRPAASDSRSFGVLVALS